MAGPCFREPGLDKELLGQSPELKLPFQLPALRGFQL